jgi:hypothetical protein
LPRGKRSSRDVLIEWRTVGVSSGQAATDAAQTLAARRDEIARGWADLPLFTTV